ncbi:hypothetical protein Hamer_G005943 [Homarus americanus]|uniref:Uncharacterized protein n=1 Tax=Homarus americanus TaxID=6706 RepID=A0A8J5JL53_HOMAM|nr:hypothetical protein Hamer_G005943 [Homarus americanus]
MAVSKQSESRKACPGWRQQCTSCRLIPVMLDAVKPGGENDIVSLPACLFVNLGMTDAEMSPAGILSSLFQ